ncbi:LicD family protein [Butyrivibrio sp. X503]|uniref:LicD family protein n=1 Tax=Butyrivibrio sp. X503 TaxID=2364878 RepID=UPI000EAA2D44|nr:LicD family protein [Butyrivibrio sp. X503]RKM54471.1 LicD family protein [Butyrivibrio sp. X503]
MGIKLSEKEIKSIQIKILNDISAYCEKESLVYFLAYGSLIGAIRHKGFIPWDDDIDICMPRKDYDKLVNGYNRNNHGDTMLLSPETDPDYYVTSAKIVDTRTILKEYVSTDKTIGVYVDVFPVDTWPNDLKLAQRHQRKILFWRRLLTLKNLIVSKDRGILKNIVISIGHVILFPVSKRKIIEKIMVISQKYNYIDNPKYKGTVSEPDYGMGEIMPSEWMEEITEAVFENYKFKVPVHYDDILKQLYGDYMKLPPKEMQVSHHGFDVWWK